MEAWWPGQSLPGVRTKPQAYYGYELHAAIRIARGRADRNPDEPQLIERLRLTPAGQDIVEPSLQTLDAILATGQPIRYLIVDRQSHYKQYQRWLQPLIRRGVKQVHDLREDETGFKEWNGALMAAGVPHCPATPARLGAIAPLGLPPGDDATEQQRQDHASRKAAFDSAIAEREQYAATRHSPLDEQGTSRWICPACSGKIGCPLRPGTVQVAQDTGLPIVASPPDPDHAPAICRQAVSP